MYLALRKRSTILSCGGVWNRYVTKMILVFVIIVVLLYLLYLKSRTKFDYWKKRNVVYRSPKTIFGNFQDYILFKREPGFIEQELCKCFPDAPYVGAFFGTEPVLIIKDPDIIKLVTTKDYYYFNGREGSDYSDKEVITQNLFFTYGDRWRVMRQNMTPLFSLAKMKNMFPLIANAVKALDSILEEDVSLSSTIEIRDLMSSYTMDCIGSCSFGVNTNTLSRSTEINPFKVIGEKMFVQSTFGGIRNMLRSMWPAIFYAFGFQLFEKQVTNFFYSLLTGVFESRQYSPSSRNDFVDLFLGLKKNDFISGDSIANLKTGKEQKINLKVDDDLVIANCALIFGAGFETSATTLSLTLFELAKNQEAQKKAAADVDSYLEKHKEMTYDCASGLPYLDACVDETLRLYPLLTINRREVMEDYTFPSGLKVDRGVRIHLPVYYLHHNPEYFPEPEQYRPERFLGEEKKNIRPYTYMPFGVGPRICIGMRFAKMQMLPGLVTILSKYRVELAEGMHRTLQFDPKPITTHPIGGIYLKLTPRKK